MGWLDRINAKKEEDKLPPRLREKTPEQVVKELEEADKLKADLAASQAAQAAQDAKVQEIQTEFDAVKARLAAAEARNTPPPKKEEGTDPTPENILADPKKVLDSRLAPLEQLTIHNNAQTARMLAQQQLNNADMASGGKNMDGRLFQAWGQEIDAEARKYQSIQLIRPEAWLGIYWYLKGTHSDELANPEIRKKKYNFLEPSTGPGTPPGGEPPKKDGVEGLTDKEKEIARKMGVTPENYAKRKKEMVMVNG
jgi:phage I-like protein